MPSTPQSMAPEMRQLNGLRSTSNIIAQDYVRHSSDEKSRRSRPASTQSRPSQTNTPQRLREKTPGSSSESIRPLRNDSQKSSGSGTLVVKPEPIHIRSGRDVDPEKKEYNPQQPSGPTPGFTPNPWPTSSPGSQHSTTTNEWNCEYVPYSKPEYESHLGLILAYLSILNPLVCMGLSIYTISTTICLAIIAPLSLCTNKGQFSNSVINSISPVIRLHLRIIYGELESAQGHSAGHVTWSAILAPFYALFIAFAAWVVAVFWCFAAILGEPNERHGEEQDGRDAIRAVRRMWERWLLWGVS